MDDGIGLEISAFGNQHIISAAENIKDLFSREFGVISERTQNTGSAGSSNYILILFENRDVLGDIIKVTAALVSAGFLGELGKDVYARVKYWVKNSKKDRAGIEFIYKHRISKLLTQIDYVHSISGTVYFGVRLPGFQPFPIGLDLSSGEIRVTNEKILMLAAALDNFVENLDLISEFIKENWPDMSSSRVLGKLHLEDNGNTRLDLTIENNDDQVNLSFVSDKDSGDLTKSLLPK